MCYIDKLFWVTFFNMNINYKIEFFIIKFHSKIFYKFSVTYNC